MTNPNWSEVARALNTIAEGLAGLSIALEAAAYTYQADEIPPDDIYDASELPPDEPARAARRPAAKPANRTTCPAHNVKWRRGNYGPYCPEKSDDPDWSNEKGFCTLTPKNAPDYLESIGASL